MLPPNIEKKTTEPGAILPKARHIAIGLKYILDFGTGETRHPGFIEAEPEVIKVLTGDAISSRERMGG
jgi:hypothetical protein